MGINIVFKKLKIILFIFLFPFLILAQPRGLNKPNVVQNSSPFTITLLPDSGNQFNVFFSYRIPFEKIVFQKGNQNFEATVHVTVEILDSANKLISRGFDQQKITTDIFDNTRDKNLFIQGFINLKISPGNYTVDPFIRDVNSGNEFHLPPEIFNTSDYCKNNILYPIVINSDLINCGDYDYYHLTNRNGHLPFSKDSYGLIIVVADTTVHSLDVSINNNDDSSENIESDNFYTGNLQLQKCAEKIIFHETGDGQKFNYFKLDNINQSIFEGSLKIKILNENNIMESDFLMPVNWDNKPFSLRDPEYAIEALKFIESDSVITGLLNHDNSEYGKVLFDYWKKFDPTPSTTFNELMTEYYERIDYASEEFKGLGRQSGINSDRSKIYIKFGRPEKVERNSDPSGNIIEKWTYNNPLRTFLFIDKNGTGNFTLYE